MDTSADQGELGELKKRYQAQLSTLKELFPDWTDADLVLAIEESDGDLQTTIEKISEGEFPKCLVSLVLGDMDNATGSIDAILTSPSNRRCFSVRRSAQESKGPVALQSEGGIHSLRRSARSAWRSW